MENKDTTIVCKDCKQEFIFTAGEQEFYGQKGFPAPVRCKSCRQAKKEANNRKEK